MNNHISQLRKKNHIHVEAAIVENTIKTIVSLEPHTVKNFSELSQLLVQFLSVANVDKYLEEAIKIQTKGVDDDLYPTDN